MKVYLAGPMTNVPHYNFPLFDQVAALLRAGGWEVISPAEEDRKRKIGAIAEASPDGKSELPETWADVLGRDLKLIADGGVEGIVFLPGWTQSRGARLEAQIGLLCDLKFFLWTLDDLLIDIGRRDVALSLYLAA